MSNHSPKVRKVIAFILTLTLSSFGAVNTGSILAAENTENTTGNTTGNTKAGDARENSQQVGQMIVTGSVTVNEKRAITGTTVFTDSRIAVACAKGNSAIVNLGRLGRIELSAGSKLLLRFSDGLISGDLLEGKAVVSTPAGVKVAVNTPEGVSSSDGKDAAVTPVATQRGVRCVPITTGSSSSPSALGSGALGALLIGIGGAAAAATAVAASENTSSASSIIP
ncbi:MAG: hypothetical protein JMDDDDMK_04075 [Acidobacteria bacterium]|nr:hypothetical protein [Acidobacteriota bacterium]